MLYINGATTDPCVNIINAPIKIIVMIKGANQYFFLVFKKSHTSRISSNNAFMLRKSFLNLLDDWF